MSSSLVAAFLYSDSAVPNGGFAFSWGLEALYRDGIICESDPWLDVLNWYLICRWAGFDRYFLSESLAADADRRVLLDLQITAAAFADAGRRASLRAGGIYLSTWSRAGSAAAKSYKDRIADVPGLGHLPIAQGVVLGEAGLDAEAAAAVSAWTLVSGLSSAAVRLGTVGALTTQRALRELVPIISDLVRQPTPAEPEAWGAFQDIAMDRHTHHELRLFAA